MDTTFFQDALVQFRDGLGPYLLGISQNAMVGAVTAWGQQQDANREQAERAAESEREAIKPLITWIEQKLLETLASLPGDGEAARLLVRELGDSVFLRLLAEQICNCRIEPEPFLDRWIAERPELQAQRLILTPFIHHFLDAVSSAIASNAEIRERITMRLLGRLDVRTERIEATLSPPTAPAAIPSLDELRQACASASQALLTWPTSIDGDRMESPAFAQLVEPRGPEESNVQLLLGEPGSGKSALLAKTGHWFLEHGSLVLAIKADLLPQSVDSVAKLGLHLGLHEMPATALRHLAQTAPVMVLIDQMDALADLVDLRGGRLNALLQFIRELGGTENLRVIASSREVEHRHDTRLATISAEPVQLPLPTWDDVQAFLGRRGIPAKDWPETFLEILRRPQQLAVFVKVLRSGEEMPIFTSYQLMLERLWTQRVTNTDGLPGRAELLKDMAMQMATEETLWLSRARFDDHGPQVEQLIASGILTTAEDERRLGYQHQTVFDFSLARSFARKGLADFVLAKQQSLFVRPRLWSGLVYLRGAEPHTYRREFAALWQRNDLRYHLRLQLVEFLGQLEDPDRWEEGYLREALAEPRLRQTGLIAIVGRRIWFERLAPDVLPQMMTDGNVMMGPLTDVLSAAAMQNGPTVITLLRNHWISRPAADWWTMSVLTNIQSWGAEATSLARILADRPSANASRLFDLIWLAAESDPVSAVSIFEAFLRRKVGEVEALSNVIDPSNEDTPIFHIFRDSPRQAAAEKILKGDTNWPDLKSMAEIACSAFIERIWPLFVRLLVATDDKDNRTDRVFRSEYGLGMSFRESPFLEAIDSSVRTLARSDGPKFAEFIGTEGQLNSMTVQRVLARSLYDYAPQHPTLAFDFLTGDLRRLKLGDYEGRHRDSGLLIASVCPHLSEGQIRSLEQFIGTWETMVVPHPDVQPEDVDRWTRHDRLRLWQYIPVQLRSHEVNTALDAGLEEFPDLRRPEHTRGLGSQSQFIGSPMSVDEMETASNAELLATLAEFPDSTGWDHPTDISKGGSIQISRAFADFAKNQPDRTLEVINQLDPSENSRPAAYALEKLAETEIGNEQLFESLEMLNDRGFQNLEFRTSAANSISKRLETGGLLPERLFAMFENWLLELVTQTVSEESEADDHEEKQSTIIWQPTYRWTSPNGTYAVLRVLHAACCKANQPDRFLTIIQTHLERPETVATWRTLCWHFDILGFADRHSASGFLVRFFERMPKVRDSVAGFRAIQEAFRWLPSESVREILEGIRNSEWPLAARGFGELIMFRHVIWDDEWVSTTISQLLADPLTPQGILTGIATTAAHAFSNISARHKASTVLQALLPIADETTSVEALGMFSLLVKLEPNPETLGVLNAFLANPGSLASGGLGPLVERLLDLIPAHSDLVADLANLILDRHTQEMLDMRTSFAASASEMINLALTLHRDEGSGRDKGLTLFERLLGFNVDGSRQSLLLVDSRPVAGGRSFRQRPRRAAVRR